MGFKSRMGRIVRCGMGTLLAGRLAAVTYRGFKFYVDLGDGVISWRLLLGIGFEEQGKDLALQIVRAGDIIFDVGANIGDYSLPLSGAVGPTGLVRSYEPVNRAFHVLRKNIERNGIKNITAIESAVGDKDGSCSIYCDASNFGGNSLMAAATTDKGIALTVPIVQLDTVCEINRMVPDLVKVDVQGAELMVLSGAKRLLENTSTAFWLEYWPQGLEIFGGSRKSFSDLAFSHDRMVYQVEGNQFRQIDRCTLEALAPEDGYIDLLSAPIGWLDARWNIKSLPGKAAIGR